MIFAIFFNLNRDFGALGIGIFQIGLQIRTRRPRIRLYANFGKFGYIISPENNQLACFFLVTLYVQHGGHNNSNYEFLVVQHCRWDCRWDNGGGVAILYRSDIKVQKITSLTDQVEEILWIKVMIMIMINLFGKNI